MNPLEENVVEVYRLLDDAMDNGNGMVSVRDVRRTLGGQPLDCDQPAGPRPGDKIMLDAVVLSDQTGALPGTLRVRVDGTYGGATISMAPSELTTPGASDQPPWWPPQAGDVVLERHGTVWERLSHYADGDVWATAATSERYTDDQLVRHFGPLTLIARGGKRWSE
jgi:hypothetical protein